MKKSFRSNSIVVAALFIITMLLGMVDSYVVMPRFQFSLSQLLTEPAVLLLGVFCIFFMAIGVVGIATTLFPILWQQSKSIAVTYASFRVIECLLLLFGAILYLYLLALDPRQLGALTSETSLPHLLLRIKLDAFQLAMMTLGIGSCLACASLYISRTIPRWLSVWGVVGYLCLFLSAILDLTGFLSTSDDLGAILYVPGGLWELFVFPIYLFINGFNVTNLDIDGDPKLAAM